ncbi:FAD/NAD(P)-binding domain-containing protein [Leucogyrophana mollusca]|uniref:FAD/NAD(P)-binding domain-containing protein n=1 Tax=Leucogyrophana mollusca TaxID=85980 RepID=A0ACB8BEK6_9AGAM|nr:FAD/NAD(P)-binding domain-containing protein [Leucogyrophana mollusca]
MANTRNVCVIGSGAAGLITAKTLLDDGFDVEILSRDNSAGGVWSANRVYPGLYTNNVNGEYQFSALPMRPLSKERPSGTEMCQYMGEFAHRFLEGKIRFNTQVLNIRRNGLGLHGWIIAARNTINGGEEQRSYDAVVLCSGGCSEPRIPLGLSAADAASAGFNGPVVHASHFSSQVEDILSRVRPVSHANPGRIVVVGGGKSAQDIAAYLANEGRSVSVVFSTADTVIASPITLPHFIRKSRLLTLMSPHIHLRTRFEQFLHTTWLGSKIVHGFLSALAWCSLKFLSVPSSSPLSNSYSMFWGVRTNDEGGPRPNRFHSLVNSGKIKLVAPSRAKRFGHDGRSIILADGRVVEADALILATGFNSSWEGLFDVDTAQELGIDKHTIAPVTASESEWGSYKSIGNPPKTLADDIEPRGLLLYHGMVPARNISRRDFAINGAVYTANPAYVFEVSSHWISSYLLSDPFLRIPSPEEAAAQCERETEWMNIRYPGILNWANESFSTRINFWDYPQLVDDLLEEMSLPIMRTGGNWFTWPFIPLSTQEFKTLGAERAELRSAI